MIKKRIHEIKTIFKVLVILVPLSLYSIAQPPLDTTHFIVGEAYYNGTIPADGANVTVINERTSEKLYDTVGLSGNSNMSGYYLVDLDDMPSDYKNDDNIIVVINGTGGYASWTGTNSTLVDNNTASQIVNVILSAPTEPVLSYSPTSHNFGDMLEGQSDSTTFEIWNSGTGTLSYSLGESCSWVSVTPSGGSSNGEHDTMTVNIDTTGLSLGHYSCDISITSNGGSGTFTVEVNIVSAPTEPVLSYSPTSHNFGDMLEGQTDSTTFEIWNSGTGTLSYSLSESCSWVSVTPSGGSSNGEHDTMTVNIDTTGLSLGHYSCDISITSNGGSGTFTVEVNIVEEIPDNEPPITESSSIPPSPNGDNNWYVSNVWLNLNGSDFLSGVNYTKYKIDSGGWKEYKDGENIVIESDGYHSIRYYSVDNYGNEEGIKSFTFNIDLNDPYTTVTLEGNSLANNSWYNGDVRVTLHAVDNHSYSSNINKTLYRIAGESRSFILYTGPFNITSDGVNTLEYFSRDNAGNTEQFKSVEVRIDKTAPNLEVSSPKKSYLYMMGQEIVPLAGFDNFAVVIGGIDISADAQDFASGIRKVEFYVDSTLRQTDNTTPYVWDWNETVIGPYTLKVKAYDTAGNIASVDVPIMIFNIK